MLSTRRCWLGLVTAAGYRLRALGAATSEIGRLLESQDSGTVANIQGRRYVARAIVTIFGVTVFSRSGVGEGYARYEDSPVLHGRSVGIEFGAGSFPEKAHGLNKMGFIRESVIETSAGERAECSYFGFMTTSQEASLDEARKSLTVGGNALTYSVGLGTVTRDRVSGCTMRIQLPSLYGWRDCGSIAREVRAAVNGRPMKESARPETGTSLPATFLYAVRKAMFDPRRLTEELLIFNGKYFVLRTEKQPDSEVGGDMVRRNVAQPGDRVVRLTATLQRLQGGNRTSFHVWFDSGSPDGPPFRFDYQAKSFLRLSFESSGPCRIEPLEFSSRQPA